MSSSSPILRHCGLGGARTTRGAAVPNIPMAMRTQVNSSILLNHCIVVLIYHCIAVLLHCCIIVLLYHSAASSTMKTSVEVNPVQQWPISQSDIRLRAKREMSLFFIIFIGPMCTWGPIIGSPCPGAF